MAYIVINKYLVPGDWRILSLWQHCLFFSEPFGRCVVEDLREKYKPELEFSLKILFPGNIPGKGVACSLWQYTLQTVIGRTLPGNIPSESNLETKFPHRDKGKKGLKDLKMRTTLHV